MCLAETTDVVRHRHEHEPDERFARRRFLMGGGALAAGTALALTAPSVPAAGGSASRHPRHRQRIVDLTHRLRKDFPTFTGDQPTDEIVADFATAGFYSKRWRIGEHTGTHIDTEDVPSSVELGWRPGDVQAAWFSSWQAGVTVLAM
jgi:hypothetical protein